MVEAVVRMGIPLVTVGARQDRKLADIGADVPVVSQHPRECNAVLRNGDAVSRDRR
jgi:hypothetical protein